MNRQCKSKEHTGKERMRKILVAALFVLLFVLYFLPAAMNGLPKGSDTYYHMGIAKRMLSTGSVVLYEPLNAGGAPNPYPPLFHMLLACLFAFASPLPVATFLGPLLALISAACFYLFSSSLLGKWEGLAATFIYGASLEIVNTALFTAPVNLGLILMFLSLFAYGKHKKHDISHINHNIKHKKKQSNRQTIQSSQSGQSGQDAMLWASTLLACLLALTHVMTFLVFVLFFFVLCTMHCRRIVGPFDKSNSSSFSSLKSTSLSAFFPLISIAVLGAWLLIAGSAGSLAVTASFDIFRYFWMFQPVFLVFLIPGLVKARRDIVALFAVLFLWALLIPLYPDRIATYSIIPASLISASGLAFLYGRASKPSKLSKSWKYAIPVILFASLLFFFDIGFTATEIRSQDMDALGWIREFTPPDSVIASPWQVSGAWMPALAERKNVLGAFQEAVPDYMERRMALRMMFSSTNPSEIASALQAYKVNYLYINGYEESVLYPGAFERLGKLYTEEYSNGYARVFKV